MFLTSQQLLFASVLMVINIGLSIIIRLGMAKQWIIASLRMTAQLLLVGFLLDWVFALNNPVWILGVALFMTTIASITAVGRTSKRFTEIYVSSFVSVLGTAFFMMFFALKGILQIDPWYSPQYFSASRYGFRKYNKRNFTGAGSFHGQPFFTPQRS